MNCPVDGSELRMTERQGVEIDYCPKCRGVWLDRGELDKLIERAGAGERPSGDGGRYEDDDRDFDDRDYKSGAPKHHPEHHKHHKKESFWSRLFDFD